MESVRVVHEYADQLAGREEAYVVRLEVAWRVGYVCCDVSVASQALGLALWVCGGAFERPRHGGGVGSRG